MSSGCRVNYAGDDIVGSAIFEKMCAQITDFGTDQRNAGDGVSFVQKEIGVRNEGIDRRGATSKFNGTMLFVRVGFIVLYVGERSADPNSLTVTSQLNNQRSAGPLDGRFLLYMRPEWSCGCEVQMKCLVSDEGYLIQRRDPGAFVVETESIEGIGTYEETDDFNFIGYTWKFRSAEGSAV